MRMEHVKRFLLVGCLSLAIATPGVAGWLDDAVKNVGEGIGRGAVGDAGNSAYEGAKGTAKDAVNGTGKPGETQPSPSSTQGTGSVTGTKSSIGKVAKTDSDAGSGGVSIEQAEAVYSKYDFIPGDKMIFFDDFSDTDVGEFPRKWSLNGPKGGNNNAVEVVEYRGNRAINQPLSEKRAAAVKTWLTGKGIEEARLKTNGFGDGKPIDSNVTPEGRANNRRVEFVKF